MTLRCDISIVPYGDESLIEQIFRLDISNVGLVEDLGFGNEICKYGVTLKKRVEGSSWENVFIDFIPEHNRRDGAVSLVEKATRLMSGKV